MHFLGNTLFSKILFIFREGKRGRKRGRDTSMCGCLLSIPHWGPGLQPRYVPWTRNRTSDTLVPRSALSPLSHTSQGVRNISFCWWLDLDTWKYTFSKINANSFLTWKKESVPEALCYLRHLKTQMWVILRKRKHFPMTLLCVFNIFNFALLKKKETLN